MGKEPMKFIYKIAVLVIGGLILYAATQWIFYRDESTLPENEVLPLEYDTQHDVENNEQTPRLPLDD